MTALLLLLPALIGLLSGLGAIILLSASRHIKTDEGLSHVSGWGYTFDTPTYRRTLLTGGLLGITTLYLIPYYLTGSVVFHWIPMSMVALLTVQSVIDLTYYELADEWTSAFALLAFLWAFQTSGLTWGLVGLVMLLFSIFYISWFFTDFPGYGDVKLIFAGGVLLGTGIGAYQFVLLSTLLAVVGTFLNCWLDKQPLKQWSTTHFAYGPYLAIAYLIALIQTF